MAKKSSTVDSLNWLLMGTVVASSKVYEDLNRILINESFMPHLFPRLNEYREK